MNNVKSLNKLNIVTNSLLATGLLLSSSAALAEDTMEDMVSEVTYVFKDGKLQEQYTAEDFITYAKKALPASCTALKVENINEKHTAQPSANIVGSWEMEAMDESGSSTSEEFADYAAYINIKANGQIEGYDYNSKDKSCVAYSVQELNGNKLTFDNGVDFDIEASLIKSKLTTVDKQLAVVNVRKEELTVDGKKESYTYPEVMLYDKAASLPSVCDINAKVPSAEKSNDNPNSALVGNWQAADVMSGEAKEQGIEFKDYYVVTGGGFLLQVFYDKQEGKENCEVIYIGETVADQYTK